MRTFIALDLPTGFRDDVAALARQLKGAVEGRFLPLDSYHLTAAFLGEVDEREAAAAIDALEAAAETAHPFALRADGLGKFGRARDATLWMGIASDPTLMAFVYRLRDELAARDVPFEERIFKPHITLARRAAIPRSALPTLAFPQPDQARTVTFYRSILSNEGATYKPLHTVTLDD